jgi:hypothetical protein
MSLRSVAGYLQGKETFRFQECLFYHHLVWVPSVRMFRSFGLPACLSIRSFVFPSTHLCINCQPISYQSNNIPTSLHVGMNVPTHISLFALSCVHCLISSFYLYICLSVCLCKYISQSRTLSQEQFWGSPPKLTSLKAISLHFNIIVSPYIGLRTAEFPIIVFPKLCFKIIVSSVRNARWAQSSFLYLTVSKGWFRCLLPAFMLIYCLAYSPTLKMKVTCSSETTVDFQQATRHYTADDRKRQSRFFM